MRGDKDKQNLKCGFKDPVFCRGKLYFYRWIEKLRLPYFKNHSQSKTLWYKPHREKQSHSKDTFEKAQQEDNMFF